MSKFELKLPKMGESVAEATLTAWLKDIGDTIEFDEAVVEIATDKVDSEVPSEKKGVLIEKCFEVNDVIKVGQTIAIIETDEIEISAETNTENNIHEENTKLNSLNDRILVHFPDVNSLNYGRSFSEVEGSYDTNYVFIVNWTKDTTKVLNYQSFENFVNDELKLLYDKIGNNFLIISSCH